MRLKKRFYFTVAGYFRFFANHAFRRWHPRVIAVTGSVGKTTMLHLIEQELGSSAHYSHDANSAFGIAFDLVGLKGVRGSKLRWLYLILAVPIKSLFYRRTETYYVVEIDGDVPLMVKACEKIKLHHSIKAEVIPCYKSECKNYIVAADHTDFTIGETNFHFYNPMPDNIAIQLVQLKALCEYLGVKLKTDFKKMPLPPGRNSYFEGKHGLKIIDSSYNAHLISMESIMDMATRIKEEPKWLVIGDMVEQGSIEKEEHEKLAAALMKVKPAQIVLLGRRTRDYTAPLLIKQHIPVYTTNEPREALKFIEENVKGGETIVFKGSQYLEWIIEKLLKNPADAKKLPRREKAAVKRRKNRGLDS